MNEIEVSREDPAFAGARRRAEFGIGQHLSAEACNFFYEGLR
jgi:hypothetical protein